MRTYLGIVERRSRIRLKNIQGRTQQYWKRCPRGAQTSVLGPKGTLEHPSGHPGVPCGPTVPPSRVLEDFGAHFWSHFAPKINQIRCWFSMWFRDAFWTGFEMFLALFWVILWSQNDDQRAKGDLRKTYVLPKQNWCVWRFEAQKMLAKAIQKAT